MDSSLRSNIVDADALLPRYAAHTSHQAPYAPFRGAVLPCPLTLLAFMNYKNDAIEAYQSVQNPSHAPLKYHASITAWILTLTTEIMNG